ncbi:carbamate kinase [Acetobacter ghanensis]|uniref:Carbamate kinase n=1 Tax=Acetobacter ghanensis TaxID=431306 RepID=A0A0U5G0K5_9PROT|nr:carbamate kinase [Acetobacter ghanensis]NHO38926.1 carbamate kinase [Acetobacter ghanensis]GBQ44753.1 carbamate kinase [Acetobacter ghanensis DSM 18895]CEF57094.1 carbamate kinase [Acetobacter ghanensis]
MKLVIALGGNALMQRGEPLSMDTQWRNARAAAQSLAPVAREHQVILTHGNGPQVGLLAMQSEAFKGAKGYPFDIMGAATEGMIGYMLEQELGNILGYDVPIATILTRVEVDRDDPEFSDPSKFIGPTFEQEQVEGLTAQNGWLFRQDGRKWRRVMPSPQPKRILWHRPIRWLLENGAVVICAGGGGIPVVDTGDNRMEGVEAVIDKDRASSLLATHIPADLFIIATDVSGVYEAYDTPDQRLLQKVTPQDLMTEAFSKGSMGPKIEAAVNFVRKTGKCAAIGSLTEISQIVEGKAGTWIVPDQATPTPASVGANPAA